MIIGFTGTKRGMTPAQRALLRAVVKEAARQPHWKEFHHGDCIGADAEAHAEITGLAPACKVVIHPPLNPTLRAFCASPFIMPQRDYLRRNHDIVDVCDVLIAAPSSIDEVLRSGTWATIRYARKQKKDVLLVFPDGTSLMEQGR